jgi:hypothetical protein
LSQPIESHLCVGDGISGMSPFGKVSGEKFQFSGIIIDEKKLGSVKIGLHVL